MKKILFLIAAAVISVNAANAQVQIKESKVPAAVKAHFEKDVNSEALKTAVWYKIGKDFLSEHQGISRRYNKYGIFVYSLEYIDKSQVEPKAIENFEKKYASEFNYQRAAIATLENGEKQFFLIAKSQKGDFYFKYTEKGKFIEKADAKK